MLHCDPESRVCTLPEAEQDAIPHATAATRATVRYVGDPMCSWCWGLSPTLKELAAYCAGHNLGFSVQMGGLRPGGGDAWNSAFKAFLRNEWEHIGQATGQPFGFSLLEAADFDYDTEPACRAVVAMSKLLAGADPDSRRLLAFLAAIQHRFYVEGEDPKTPEFYRDPCASVSVAHEAFVALFLSAEAGLATRKEFQRCRAWGVRGFPSLLLEIEGRMRLLASGYADSGSLIDRLEASLKTLSPKTE